MKGYNNKTCVIMQPTYLPWLGYFDLIRQSDIFVFLNDVQFSKQSWQVKNRIKNLSEELMITIPVKKSSLSTKIDMVLIDNTKNWKKKHLKSIYLAYKKSEFFDEIYPIIENVINTEVDFLSEFNTIILKKISSLLFGNKDFIDSRCLKIRTIDKIDRIIKICKEVKATEYLSPAGSLSYLESMNYKERFSNANLHFRVHKYEHKKYNQRHYPFTPNLSIIDLLFNTGIDQSKKII